MADTSGDEDVAQRGAQRVPPTARYRLTLTITGNTLDEIQGALIDEAQWGFLHGRGSLNEWEMLTGRCISVMEHVNPDMTPLRRGRMAAGVGHPGRDDIVTGDRARRCPYWACHLPNHHDGRHQSRDGVTWPRAEPDLTLPELATYCRQRRGDPTHGAEWAALADDIDAYLALEPQKETLL